MSLKIQEAKSKISVAINEKKENNMSDQSYIPPRGHLPTKVNLAVDFTNEPIIQYDVPVVENTYVDDYK